MVGLHPHPRRTPTCLRSFDSTCPGSGRPARALQPLQLRKRAGVPARVAELERTEQTSASAPTGELGVEVPKTDKPRIVVLGSGWGAISFMKSMDKRTAAKYDIVLLSPRNYFLYTPLLPAVATGTMEERSIVEPIRNVMYGKGAYYEAQCQSVNPETRTLVACFPEDAGFPQSCFRMQYDHLVVSVGSVNNTFGVQGVEEHCFYFKSIHDANKLRSQVSECFERAALPYTSQEDRRKLLSFVLVGGGPTGVEVAAEMYDMVTQDMKRLYPELIPLVRIRVIELMDHVLSTYDRAISDYTSKLFSRNGIELILNSRVSAVEAGNVTITNKDGTTKHIDFGACVWATGVAKHPLISQLQEHLPDQTHFRALVTDDNLCVIGSGGSLWAIGDASTVYAAKAFDYADELFEEADEDRTGLLSLSELRGILEKAGKRFPQFEEHARFLSIKQGGVNRFGGLVGSFFKQNASDGAKQNGAAAAASPVSNVTEDSKLTREQFKELLETIDKGLRGLPATAQVAGQQGKWLAKHIFTSEAVQQGEPLPASAPHFQYHHKGALAYVGQDRAVADIPQVGPLYGLGAGFVWKGFETYSQFSLRNKVLVSLDWMRAKIFGRDISRV